MVINTKRGLVASAVGVALASAAIIPASPSQAASIVEAPCIITVDKPQVVLRDAKAVDVTANIVSCPPRPMSGSNSPGWEWIDASSNTSAFSFYYRADAIYPSANMTHKFSWYDHGTYTFKPNQEYQSFSDDYLTDYRSALTSTTPTIVVKFGTTTALKVKRTGKIKRLSISGMRWMPSLADVQVAKTVVIYRNGRKFKTVRLKNGKATVTTAKSGKWQALQVETGIHWGSKSKTVTK